jgi:hypothetical protein
MSHPLRRKAKGRINDSVAGFAASGVRGKENILLMSDETGEGVHPFFRQFCLTLFVVA